MLQVLLSQPGRAKQMNVGWLHAKGDCLLFLHADSKLPLGLVHSWHVVCCGLQVGVIDSLHLSPDSHVLTLMC